MKLPTAWPVVIKKGNSLVRIYRHTNAKAGREYSEFKVASYDLTGKRKLQTFADYENAKKTADGILSSLSAGDSEALTLSSKDSLPYQRAIQSLKPTGVQLDLAAHDFAKAWEILRGVSL